ncbi:GGDEF domain-containing response regulator [Hydrogenovibrio kuenenii]|uniref:GGDEF domain-containing response regulator n=1 Tax=Hydrogenovibrio kuenenii TaxID=63658 RepID=UPI00247FC9B6|nr:diguanylate cyclase [Hydrogenovibrio kuenenii]
MEDQKSMALLLRARLLECCPKFEIFLAHTFSEAKKILEKEDSIQVCLTDLTLPDSSNYEIVDLLKSFKVATVVFTGSYSEAVRHRVFDAHVADYVIKDGQVSIDYAVSSVHSLLQNPERTIWILSDNIRSIHRTQGLLRIQRYQLKVFEDYIDLIRALDDEVPDLLIIDRLSDERKMSVYDLVREIRTKYSDHDLPIISIEKKNKINQSIKLMKYGVGDLVSENYSPEELYLRVRKNLEQSQAYKDIKRISEVDALTQIYNRRAFFEKAEQMFECYQNEKRKFFLIMVDIDHFKQVNDKYGHQIGDQAIIFTATYLKSVFSNELVARFGGEEFIVLGECDSVDKVSSLCEVFRQEIEVQSYASIEVEFTVSQGVAFSGNSLDKAIAKADELLYEAKQAGRNQVVTESQKR